MERTELVSSRRQEVSDDGQNVGPVDRISGLPDGVIYHILSFLPTKLSVATSILARRWRFLWAHVPNLDFDYSAYSLDKSFSSIVNRVMLRHKLQTINTFRFFGNDSDCSGYDLETWVITAIERNVQNLEISFNPGCVLLPQCLFNSKTLVDLSFGNFVFPTLSGAISLPSLKKLFLGIVGYVAEENLPRLLSGCTVLEELTISKIRDSEKCFLNISSTTIKRLIVNLPYVGFLFEGIFEFVVKINAPALTYFRIWNFSCELVSFSRPVNSLSEAYISLNSNTLGEIDSYTRSVLKFLDSLCNVKLLHYKCIKNHDLAVPCSIVKFHNLTKLEFVAHWRLLTYFLENADNLQVLIIYWVNDNKICWLEPHQVPKCLLSHLRSVRIDNVGDPEHEFELIRYLLRNAKVLEKMEIHYRSIGNDLKPKFDALQRISSFKRGSEECELIFR